jgi:hypothetical protein
MNTMNDLLNMHNVSRILILCGFGLMNLIGLQRQSLNILASEEFHSTGGEIMHDNGSSHNRNILLKQPLSPISGNALSFDGVNDYLYIQD